MSEANENDQYHQMRMNGLSPGGLPIHEPIQCFIDHHMGVATGGAMLTEKTQPDGVSKYWEAKTDDVCLFGSPVCCELKGYGRTQEEALKHLEQEKNKLSDSLWE